MLCDPDLFRQLSELSPKHRDVLDRVAQHRTTKEIARELQISPHTVEQRIQAIRGKFGEVSRRDLGRIYAEFTREIGGQVLDGEIFAAELPSEDLPPDLPLAQSASRRFRHSVLVGFVAGFFSGLAIAIAAYLVALIAIEQVIR